MMNNFTVFAVFLCFSAYSTVDAKLQTDTTINGRDTIIEWKHFSKENKLTENYKTINGKYEGRYEEFFNSGSTKSISYYYFGVLDSGWYYFPTGRVNGYVTGNGVNVSFFENGDTSSLSIRKNDRLIGMVKSYYGNRHFKTIENFNDSGQKHGLCETWREDGTRIDSVVYRNGDYEEIRKYYVNGKVRYHACYSGLAILRKIFYDGATLDDVYPNCINAEFYSISSSMPISKIKNGKGISIRCDSLGAKYDTVHFISGVPVPKDCTLRPKNVSKKALPKKGECWFDVIPSTKK